MNIRYGRLRTFAVLGTLTTLAFSTVQAGQVGGSENQLLGITLRSSTFRDVLRKYGQPDEVQGGGPFLPTPPKTAAAATGGGRSSMPGYGGMPGSGGGMPGSGGGMPGSGGGMRGGAGGGSRRFPSKSGFPGMNDGGAAGGAPGAGGPGSGGRSAGGYPGSGGGPGSPGGFPGSGGGAGGYPGYPGGFPGSGGGPGSPGGFPGSGGGPGGYPGSGGGGKGLPGFPGAGEGGSGGGVPGLPGSGDTVGSEQAEELPPNEATWWYHNPRKGYHMSFLFNKEGRVIQIQEYGWASLPGGKTRQGIALGSNMTQVLSRYGWSNDGAHDGTNVIMRYGGANKVAFQMVKNTVLGITVAVGH